MPVVVAGSAKQVLRLVTDGDDREAYVPAATATTPAPAAALEELQLSSFATAGKLDNQYALILSDDTRPDADVSFKWEPPAVGDVPATGLTVHFHFVVRDGRGGLDWTHRALCVVAP
jgi:hypothetical protein